jgi:hypothetical protein
MFNNFVISSNTICFRDRVETDPLEIAEPYTQRGIVNDFQNKENINKNLT